MSKTALHDLIDLIDESDTETIYKVLIRFVPEAEPLPDEQEAIGNAKLEIMHGEVTDIDDIDWGL